uniref:Prolamin-like domain-containing protein n=1 Tax=Quercus lobata TaxID=97700 RepID=A0A7N2MXR1_QUELO
MAASSNIFVMMILFIATLSVTPGLGISSDQELPPDPSPEYRKHLHECAQKISEDNGDEVFYSTFFNNVTVSNGCCVQLRHLGKSCHDDLVNFLLEAPDLGSKIDVEALGGWDSDRCGLVDARGSPWVGFRSPWVASNRRGWDSNRHGWVQIIVSGCGAVGALMAIDAGGGGGGGGVGCDCGGDSDGGGGGGG